MDNITKDTSSRIVRQSTGFAAVMLSFALIFLVIICSCVILWVNAQREILKERISQIRIVSQEIAYQYEPVWIIVEMCDSEIGTEQAP